MSARVLITGATGFVGSHIAEAFARAGYTLRCSVRAGSDPRWIAALDPELVHADLSAPDPDFRPAVEGVEIVVHAGGVTRARTDVEYHHVNARATERLARAAAAAGARRFIYISSIAARGPDSGGGPNSPYGWSKREGERLLTALDAPLERVMLRVAAVYGPRDSDLLPLFGMAAQGWLAIPLSRGPVQPVFAEDVGVAALRAAAVTSPGPGAASIYPVAERGLYQWAEFGPYLARALGRRVRTFRLPGLAFYGAGLAAELAARITGRSPEFDRRRAGDLARHSYTCDPTETETALGWQAAVSLPEGLERTVRWYREAGWL